MKSKFFLLPLLCVSFLFLTIQSGKADPFVHALKTALENNPSVKAAEGRLLAARELLPQSRAALLPNIGLNLAPSYTYSTWDGGDDASDSVSLSLSLNQALYNKQALVAFDQTSPYISAFESDLSATVQGVFLQVAGVSVGLLQAREVVRLAENNLTVTKRHLQATQARFEVGEITHTDVSQAEARLASAQAGKVQAENAVSVLNAQFQEVVGSPAPDGLKLPSFRNTQSSSKEDWLKRLEQRPDLQASRLRKKVAELEVDLQHAGHWPTVNISSSAGRNWSDSSTTDPVDLFSLGVQVSVPLFSGGATLSKTNEARAKRDVQMAQTDQLRRQAVREIEKAFSDLQSARALTKSYQSVVTASQSARDGVEREFQVGSRTALDLLDAQNELFSSQTDLTKSRYAQQFSRFQLLGAVGQLTLDELVIEPSSTP